MLKRINATTLKKSDSNLSQDKQMKSNTYSHGIFFTSFRIRIEMVFLQ